MASLETQQITGDQEGDLTQFNLNLLFAGGQGRTLIGGQVVY